MFCNMDPYCGCEVCMELLREDDKSLDLDEDDHYHDLHQVWLESFEYSELSNNEEGE